MKFPIFISVLISLCCGCSRPHKNTDKKHVRLYLQTHALSLDPRIGGNRVSSHVTRHLFEGLFRIDRHGKYSPALAKNVIISQDKCLYTFELHHSKWSNGEDVTAYDFEYAWKSILDPSFPSAFSYLFYDIKNAVEAYQKKCSSDDIGIKATDSHTLQVTLKHPTPFFLELVANPLFSPLPRSYCQKENWSQKVFPDYVSNGPFILKKHDLKSQIILEKNPFYWGRTPPQIDTLSFTVVEDPQTAYNMFCVGALDWFGEPCGPIPLNMLNGLDPNALHTQDTGQSTWLECQIDKPPLNSQLIRKALATAIDRDVICNQFLEYAETPAYSVLPKFLTLLSAPSFKNGDVQEANLLFEKGLKELGITKKKCPPLTLLYTSDQTPQTMAGLIRTQLSEALGIEIILEECDYHTFLSRICSDDFELALSNWFSLYRDPMYTLNCFKHKETKMIGPPWEDPIYIETLNKASAAISDKERQQYLKEAEERVVDQLPIIPILYKTHKHLKPNHLHGYALSEIGQMDFTWTEKSS